MGDVARALGISVVYVSDIERGNRQPPLHHARKWAECVGGDPNEFERVAMADRVEMSFRLDGLNDRQRHLLGALASMLPSLSDEAITAIERVLNQEPA